MSIIKTCNGCGAEMDMKIEKMHPQGKEWYCDLCNKKYSLYVTARGPIYDKYDKMKDDDLAATRKAIFGDRSVAQLTNEEKDAILMKLKQDQSAINKLKAEASQIIDEVKNAVVKDVQKV